MVTAMIDIKTETLLNLPDAARRIPSSRGGKPTHPATVCRLIQSGKLEGIRLGGRWVTSLEALQRYADRETIMVLGESPPAGSVSAQRRRERAEREADALGI
jgi:hypothetical protein